MPTPRPALHRRTFLLLVPAALAALLALPASTLASAQHAPWVATWGASPQVPGAALAISGQTIRQVAHVSLGGETIRIRISNAFGTDALPLSEVHVALSADGSSTVPGTDRHVTFGGSPTTNVPPGALVVSDPIHLQVPALSNVTVSMWFPGSLSATTEHSLGVQTTWIAPGNFAGDSTFPSGATTTTSFYFLNGIEVAAQSPRAAAVVTLGDSITDGYASTVSANHRWPNFLAARLQGRGSTRNVAVVNEGISGNRVLHDFIGPNALSRLDRDVLVQSGAAWVVVLEGINDIGIPGAFAAFASQQVSADEIIEGHKQIIARAHAQGLRIYGGTLTPFEGTIFPGYFSPEGEAKRQAVNHWIRTSGAYDAVIDFDAAVRDPAHPTRMLPAYDSGDHLHPNDAGYQAMANAVDLRLFQN